MSGKLEKRRMGRTEMQPNSLGLGAAWLCHKPDDEVITSIRRAIELGINYIDTYPGHAEHLWGVALSDGLREQIYLQAKVGTHPERRKDFTENGTRWSVTNSLRDLQTEYLDAVLIHDPENMESILDKGQALDTLLELKSEGKIRHIGAGVRSHEFHKELIETGHIDIILTFLDYTLLSQTVTKTTFPLAREYDVGLILASPLGMGSLTGVEPKIEDEKRRNPDGEPQAHSMWKWCQEKGVNIRHFAMQFCLAAPIDGIVMFGPADQAQVEDGYEAATATIPEEVWEAFEKEFGIRPGI
ncbi:aldo/keto reductase [Candidatus Poribacteria bacterium]|nr:aldo/keto reductase [Candidatus Poribacteria bacterium]